MMDNTSMVVDHHAVRASNYTHTRVVHTNTCRLRYLPTIRPWTFNALVYGSTTSLYMGMRDPTCKDADRNLLRPCPTALTSDPGQGPGNVRQDRLAWADKACGRLAV
jgi:hypothetical protein